MFEKGLFIVLEGIDKSGKSLQSNLLHNYLSDLNKYNTIITTHEPWKNTEIKKKLVCEKDAYSNGLRCADLFVNDRVKHTSEVILPNLNAGGIVLCDRYSMSTCAYQWAQKVKVEDLIEMHVKGKKEGNILTPDLTFFIDIDSDTALERMAKSGRASEKFEGSREFISNLIECYHELALLYNCCYDNIFGKIELIDGKRDVSTVHHQMRKAVRPVYEEWEIRGLDL